MRNTIIFLWLFSCLEVFCQNSLIFEMGLSSGFRSFNNTPSNTSYKDYEYSKLCYNARFLLEKSLRNFSLYFGVGYENLGEIYKPEYQLPIVKENFKSQYQYQYNYQYLGLPILISYSHRIRKIVFSIRTGLSLNYLTDYSKFLVSKENAEFYPDVSGIDFGELVKIDVIFINTPKNIVSKYNRFNIFYELTLPIKYYLNDKFSLSIIPRFSQNIIPTLTVDKQTSQYNYSFGVNLGMGILLK